MSNDLRRAEEAVMEAVMKWRKQHPDMERGLGYLGEIIEAADHLSALRASQAGEPYWCGRCAKVVTDTEPSGHRLHSKCRGIVSDPPPSYAPTPPAECSGCGKSHGGPACDFSGIDPRPVEKGG